MWEEGITTKAQFYYNNNHTNTLQASKQKKYTEVENTKHNTKKTHNYTEEHTYIKTYTVLIIKKIYIH